MHIVDASDVTHPVKIGELPLTFFTKQIQIVDDLAYLTSESVADNSQLRIVDVSDPTHLTVIGGTDFSVGAGIGIASAKVVGNYMYVTLTHSAGAHGFRVINISNPVVPVVVGGSALNTGPYLSGGYSQGIDVVLPYAFVSNEESSTAAYFNVIDVTNPAAPTMVNSETIGSMVEPRSPIVLGRYCFTLSGNNFYGFTVFDINDPALPVIRRRIPLTNISHLPNGITNLGGGKLLLGTEVRENFPHSYSIVDVNDIYKLKMYYPTVTNPAGQGMPCGGVMGNYVCLGFYTGALKIIEMPVL